MKLKRLGTAEAMSLGQQHGQQERCIGIGARLTLVRLRHGVTQIGDGAVCGAGIGFVIRRGAAG